MKFFVVLALALNTFASVSFAADFDASDPSTWDESHKIAARFEYCTWAIRHICPQNIGKSVGMDNPFAAKKHECPNFTKKLILAQEVFYENTPNYLFEHSNIVALLRKDLENAKKLGTLDIPLSAYDNCQNDVEQFLVDNYEPTFDLKTFGD